MAKRNERVVLEHPNTSSVIFDSVLKGENGTELRMVIDAGRVQSDIDKYYNHLMYERNIVFDRDNIVGTDPYLKEVMEKMPAIVDNPARVMFMVRKHYEDLSTQAYREAVMLALTFRNEFIEIPEPYEPEFLEEDDLPGFIKLSQPKRDMEDLVEYRLKQLYDVLRKDMTIMLGFNSAFDAAMVELSKRINGLQTVNGFSA